MYTVLPHTRFHTRLFNITANWQGHKSESFTDLISWASQYKVISWYKLHTCYLQTAPPPPPPPLALRPSRQESQTAQRRPLGPDIDNPPPPPPPPALRPSRQESQTAQRRPLGPDTNSPPPPPPPPQSYTVRVVTLRVSARWSTSSLSLSQTFSGSMRMLRVCSTTVLLRAALSELQRSESATSLQNP
jgi:hypothetical protein